MSKLERSTVFLFLSFYTCNLIKCWIVRLFESDTCSHKHCKGHAIVQLKCKATTRPSAVQVVFLLVISFTRKVCFHQIRIQKCTRREQVDACHVSIDPGDSAGDEYQSKWLYTGIRGHENKKIRWIISPSLHWWIMWCIEDAPICSLFVCSSLDDEKCDSLH